MPSAGSSGEPGRVAFSAEPAVTRRTEAGARAGDTRDAPGSEPVLSALGTREKEHLPLPSQLTTRPACISQSCLMMEGSPNSR